MMKSLVVGLALAVASVGAFAQRNAVVRVVNNSSYDVYFLYTSAAADSSYGERDLLGDDVIPAGGSRIINFDVPDARNKCVQDVIAKSASRYGKRWTKRIDVCESARWTLYD